MKNDSLILCGVLIIYHLTECIVYRNNKITFQGSLIRVHIYIAAFMIMNSI